MGSSRHPGNRPTERASVPIPSMLPVPSAGHVEDRAFVSLDVVVGRAARTPPPSARRPGRRRAGGLASTTGVDREGASGAGADDQAATVPGDRLEQAERGVTVAVAEGFRCLLVARPTRPWSTTTSRSKRSPSISMTPNETRCASIVPPRCPREPACVDDTPGSHAGPDRPDYHRVVRTECARDDSRWVLRMSEPRILAIMGSGETTPTMARCTARSSSAFDRRVPAAIHRHAVRVPGERATARSRTLEFFERRWGGRRPSRRTARATSTPWPSRPRWRGSARRAT